MKTIPELIVRLRSIADHFPEEIRPVFGNGAAIDAIAKLQSPLPSPLPDSFVKFLAAVDFISAPDIWNGYFIGNATWIHASRACGDFPTAVETETGQALVTAIATDGGGNAFLLSHDDKWTWKWDHERSRATVVAHGFTEFLHRVAVDWEHFLANDNSWKYLAG